jgi:hypothetical protein
MEIATIYSRSDGKLGRMKTNGRFALKFRKYTEEVQYENQYTQEGSVYALGQRVALARNEHHNASATSQQLTDLVASLRQTKRATLRANCERP